MNICIDSKAIISLILVMNNDTFAGNAVHINERSVSSCRELIVYHSQSSIEFRHIEMTINAAAMI